MAKIWPNSGQTWSNSSHTWPTPGEIRSNSADVGRVLVEFRQTLAASGHEWSDGSAGRTLRMGGGQLGLQQRDCFAGAGTSNASVAARVDPTESTPPAQPMRTFSRPATSRSLSLSQIPRRLSNSALHAPRNDDIHLHAHTHIKPSACRAAAARRRRPRRFAQRPGPPRRGRSSSATRAAAARSGRSGTSGTSASRPGPRPWTETPAPLRPPTSGPWGSGRQKRKGREPKRGPRGITRDTFAKRAR